MDNKQQLKIRVTEINKSSNEVLIVNEEGEEGWFPIKAPANIKWVKLGDADVTISNSAITYLKNINSNPPTPSTYPPRPSNSFLKKEVSQEPRYPLDDKPDWDRIGWGKCKFSFLIEAFKLGKNLEDIELECERWATASMNKLTEEQIIKLETKKLLDPKKDEISNSSGPKMTNLGVF